MPLTDPDEESEAPVWSAGAVAAYLGVSAVTLRSWGRRYGLDPVGHVSGRHRRYRPGDVARFATMRRLIAAGMASADAARWVQSHPPELRELLPGSGAEEYSLPDATSVHLEDNPDASANGTLNPESVTAQRAVTALLAAAKRLDSDAVAGALDRHLAHRGVVSTWDDICVPALTQIGERNQNRGDCVDVERLLSWTVSAAFQRIPGSPGRLGGRLVLLACVAGEQHALALEALRAALAQQGITVRMLGAATPNSALLAAVERSRPGAIVAWAQTNRTARPSILTQLIRTCRRLGSDGHDDSCAADSLRPAVVLAGGPGWDHGKHPVDVTQVRTLSEALRLTLNAVASPVRAVTPSVPRC